MKRPGEDGSREAGAGYDLLSVALTFGITLAGFVLLGLWGDRKLGTTPLLTVVGTFLGIGLGGFWMWQRIKRSVKGRTGG